MEQEIYFGPVTLEVPLKRIYARLGFRELSTRCPERRKKEVQRYIDEAVALVRLQAVAKWLPIEKVRVDGVELAGRKMLSGSLVAGFLKGADAALLMAATAGKEIVSRIRADSRGDHPTRGVVFDGVASEMADAALEWVMEYSRVSLRRQNKRLTRKRISAGYGDFSLDNQKVFLDVLELKRLGVSLTSSLLLVPEKSVTAVAGISGRS